METELLMSEIKIGRNVFTIKKGDYIQYNQHIYLFCSGDGRTLKFKGFDMYDYVVIPKSLLKKIPLNKMTRVESGNKEVRDYIEKWYF